jgi:hypothetical protein
MLGFVVLYDEHGRSIAGGQAIGKGRSYYTVLYEWGAPTPSPYWPVSKCREFMIAEEARRTVEGV